MPNIDVSELYENGKHRRYSLLFAVNGGTLAIAKYLGDNLEGTAASAVVGSLTIEKLSFGMVIFSIVMVWDIYAFGSRMHAINPELFRLPGRMVLCLLGTLICIGWLIAGSYIVSTAEQFWCGGRSKRPSLRRRVGPSGRAPASQRFRLGGDRWGGVGVVAVGWPSSGSCRRSSRGCGRGG